MLAHYEVIESSQQRPATATFARDVLRGLVRTPKSIPSKYFYDVRGSRLFQQITELEEYYPTRSELEIFQTHADQIAAILPREPFRLVELGAGDGRKTEILLRHFLQRKLQFDYVPIDICKSAVVELTTSLCQKLAGWPLRAHGIVAEYFDALALLARRCVRRNVVLFLGSNIGNFDARRARRLLARLRGALNPGDYLMIGFDLKKDIEVLSRAYNDARGVTREFNFNLLDRINRELDGQFDREQFMHYAPYNVRKGRMESWLLSLTSQEVPIGRLDRSFRFEPWEGMFLECSYKYDLAEIEGLAAESGFAVRQHFFDQRRYFLDSLWQIDRA